MNESLFELVAILGFIVFSLLFRGGKKKLSDRDSKPAAKGFLATILEEIKKAREEMESRIDYPTALPKGVPEPAGPSEKVLTASGYEAIRDYESRGKSSKELRDTKKSAVTLIQKPPLALKPRNTGMINQNKLREGILWYEVLGPPVSRRPKRRAWGRI